MKKIITILVMFAALTANAQWVPTDGVNGGAVLCFTISGMNIFTGTVNGGVYLSTNEGANWTAVNNGLTNPNVNALTVIGTNVFAGTYGGGVFLSTNNGSNWTSAGLPNQYIQTFAISGTSLFAGTNNSGVYLSTNNGAYWTSAGLTAVYVNTLAISGSNIFAGTNNGVFLSTNNGGNWTPVINGLTNQQVLTLSVSGLNIFAGTNNGAFITTNNGAIWTPVYLSSLNVYSLIVSGTTITAGTSEGVYLSTNYGLSWLAKNQGFNPLPLVYTILITNNYILAGTSTQSVWRRSYTEIIGIQNISTEIPSAYSLKQNYPNPFNSMTRIKFDVASTPLIPRQRGRFVKLVVYDAMGREIQTLVNERLQSGTYEASFDGSALNSGIYFYKLITDGFTKTKKMILIK